MQTREFLNRVVQRTDLDGQLDAQRATLAVLETLAHRLAGGEPKDLASQLPAELACALKIERETDPFGLDVFYEQVAEREGVSLEQAEAHARAVVSVLMEAVSQGEIGDVRAQLPGDYAPLFGQST
jgi:uncharacterized protein (DUF2267 family)